MIAIEISDVRESAEQLPSRQQARFSSKTAGHIVIL